MAKAVRQEVLQYIAVFEPDAEAGGYSVIIPALPGCVSEGDTFEEAFANIKEAAELYLEVMQSKHEEIPREAEGIVVAPVRVHA